MGGGKHVPAADLPGQPAAPEHRQPAVRSALEDARDAQEVRLLGDRARLAVHEGRRVRRVEFEVPGFAVLVRRRQILQAKLATALTQDRAPARERRREVVGCREHVPPADLPDQGAVLNHGQTPVRRVQEPLRDLEQRLGTVDHAPEVGVHEGVDGRRGQLVVGQPQQDIHRELLREDPQQPAAAIHDRRTRDSVLEQQTDRIKSRHARLQGDQAPGHEVTRPGRSATRQPLFVRGTGGHCEHREAALLRQHAEVAMPVADHRRTCDAMPQERRDAVVDVGARMQRDQLGHHDVPRELGPVDRSFHRNP